MSKVITKFFTKKIADAVKNDLVSNVYYFALSKYSTWPDENNPTIAYDTRKNILNFQKEIIAGKRIKEGDITSLVTRNLWQSNTVYSQYDDIDEHLYDEQFFVINGNEAVFKCLFNNYGAPSTVEPTEINTVKSETSDGYIWKYMYNVTTANNTKFSLSSYIPVDPNTTISSAASNGAINILLIEQQGSGYRGFIEGSIATVVSNSIFEVQSTGSLSTENFFYNRSGFYITSGTGKDQLTSISNYVVNSSGHFIYTAEPINNPVLDLTSNFRIAPQVVITGDGTGAKAYCTVNSVSGSYFVESVNMLSYGKNYSYANVQILANPAYGSGATVRAVMSPENGHGYDAATELACKRLGISLLFNNNENSSISTDVPFRQAGILFVPKKFISVKTFNAANGVSNTSNVILFPDANTYFTVGDYVTYYTGVGNTAVSGLANNTNYYISFTNSTSVALTSAFGGANIDITSGSSEVGHYIKTSETSGNVTFNALTAVSNTNDCISIPNANSLFQVGDEITYVVAAGNTAIGGLANGFNYYVVQSNTTAIKMSNSLDGTAINLTAGVSQTGHSLYTSTIYSSNTFNSLYYLNISGPTGSYTRNELLVGGTSGATATIAFANSSIIKIGYPTGTFVSGETVKGSSSLATSTVSSINIPDVQPISAEVLYIDNVQVLTRADNKYEQAYLVLNI